MAIADTGAPQARAVDEITARIERLPASWALRRLVVLISCGGWFEIYDLFFTGYIAPGLIRSGILEQTTSSFLGFSGMGAFIAAMFGGLFIGTFFLGSLADRFGRKRVFTLSLVWYSAASALMAFQTDVSGLLLCRFVTGIGVGVQVVAMDSYLAEISPTKLRGRAFALNHVVMFTAVPTVALLSWALVPYEPFGVEGWRFVVLIGSLGAFVTLAIQRHLPEAPIWLASRGRLAEAEAQMAGLEAAVERERGALPPPQPLAVRSDPPSRRVSRLLKPPYRTVFLMLLVYNVAQAIGFYGFSNWVPTLLIEKGITVTKSLFYASFIAVAYPLGPLLAMRYADRIERKWVIVGAAAAIATIGMLMAMATTPGVLVVLGVLLTLANITMSYTYHAYQVEVFPTEIRAQGAGIVYSASRIGAMSSGFIIAFVLANWGVLGVFTMICGMMAIVIVAVSLFGPRVYAAQPSAASAVAERNPSPAQSA